MQFKVVGGTFHHSWNLNGMLRQYGWMTGSLQSDFTIFEIFKKNDICYPFYLFFYCYDLKKYIYINMSTCPGCIFECS